MSQAQLVSSAVVVGGSQQEGGRPRRDDGDQASYFNLKNPPLL
jgi:hypothetical protein